MQFVLATFLALISAPLVKKILVALGFGLISYTGFVTIKSTIDSQITSYLNSLTLPIYQLLGLIGFIDAIGVWLGAFTTVVGVLSLKRFGLL